MEQYGESGRALLMRMEAEAVEEGRAFARRRLEKKIAEYERTHGALSPPQACPKQQSEASDEHGRD